LYKTIAKGETINFTLTSGKYYSMQLSFSDSNTYSTRYGMTTLTREGKSNQWNGTLIPGKYHFECGIEPGINPVDLFWAVLSLGDIRSIKLYLNLKAFEEC
ncbi:hypothetical protein WDZ92_18300, partial [Nostoc sp. NIES-2111]